MELDQMVQALQSRGLLVGQVQVLLDSTPSSQPARPTTLITLVPKQWPVSEEGTKPLICFCVRSDSEDNSRKNEGRSPQAHR